MKNSGIEWIGEIPDSWETKTIKQLVIERIEKNSEYQTSTILSLSAKDGVTLYDGEHHAGNRPREDLSDYKVVYPNDIVANSMNILSGSVGLSSYKGCVSPVYYIYHLRSNDDIEFLHYIFQCKQFQLSLRGLGNGIMIKESENGNLNTIRMRIPAQKLAAQVFPYCSLEEQKKIVAYLNAKLSQVDELIANQQGQIEKLKEYKQSVITEAVTKGLDKSAPLKDSGIEWIGEIPAHWEVSNLGNLLKEHKQPNDEVNSNALQFKFGTIIRKKEQNLTADVVEMLSKYNVVEPNIIMVNGLNLAFDFITQRVAIVEEEGVITSTYLAMKPTSLANPKYFTYLLKSYDYQKALHAMGRGLRSVLSYETFRKEKVLLPKLVEQQQIVAFLDEKCGKIDRIIAIKQEKIEKLQEYKKSLIYEYVTGKKEVV